MERITGMLRVYPAGTDPQMAVIFECNALVGVWQLQYDESLRSRLRDFVGRNVTIHGEQIPVAGMYGGIFRVDSVEPAQ